MGLKIERVLKAATWALCGAAMICAFASSVQAAPAKTPDEDPAPTSPADLARMKKAAAQERTRDWAGVVQTLKPSAGNLPRKGLLQLARAYAARKDFANQVIVLESVANETEGDYYALTLLGDALMGRAEGQDAGGRAKDREAAAGAYRDAIAANKGYRLAYDGLLNALEKLEDHFEERSVLNDVLKRFGPSAPYLSALCRLYSIESFIDKALEVCRQAIESDAKIPDNHVYLGLSMREKEEPRQAEKILTTAAKRFQNSEFAQWAAGQLTYEAKNYAASHAFYFRGTRADPNSARCWLGAGKASLENNEPKDALEEFVRACELDRQTLPEYKKAAGLLRQRKLPNWAARFDAEESKCGTKQRKSN